MAKLNQRLTHARIAEALGDRGLVDKAVLQDALQQDLRGEMIFAESLVAGNHIGDWELSQVVCEVCALPFVPVDIATPNSDLLDLVDDDFLQRKLVIPLARYGKILTVCLPGVVSPETLGAVEKMTQLSVTPVIGTVRTNRKWVNERVGPVPDPALPIGGDWSNIFDEGDAAVLLELEDDGSSE